MSEYGAAKDDAWWRRAIRWWDHLFVVDLYDDDIWKQR